MADMRKCIGSAKFGIEAHEALVADFPAQPSQKDGLGRMCKEHWIEYTRALRKAALARKAAAPDSLVAATLAKMNKAIAAGRLAERRAVRAGAAPTSLQGAWDATVAERKAARGHKTEGEQIAGAVDAAIAREAHRQRQAAARGRKLDLDEAGEIRTEPAPDGHVRDELIADFKAAGKDAARGRKALAPALLMVADGQMEA